MTERKPQRGLAYTDVPKAVIHDSPIEKAIPKILNDTNALLLLDGLDEVGADRMNSLQNEIQRLAYALTQSKIVLSSRSGDFVQHMDGFDLIEICPLESHQIAEVANKWLDSAEKFLQELAQLPYRDVADRPLFLTYLIFFYRSYGYLPQHPSAVYRKIIGLMLEDWDAQRKVSRKSTYASFNPERKIEFLSALSYHLTYKIKTKVFSTSDLTNSYLAIYQSFDLPQNQAKAVAKEIETHTGIVLAGGLDSYEFSHLSLQEYLCANYLVREPFAKNIPKYLREYPAPVAIAVALSANPSDWFSALVLRQETFVHLRAERLATFLSRLLSEKPSFSPEISLGLCTLKLFFELGCKSDQYVQLQLTRLLEYNGVRESVAKSLTWFAIVPEGAPQPEHLLLKRRFLYVNDFGFETPKGGYFPKNVLLQIGRDYSVKVMEHSDGGLVIPFTGDPSNET